MAADKRLPGHDFTISVPAGAGWTAHVAIRGENEVVGVLVTPSNGRRIPHEPPDMRKVRLGEARGRAATRVVSRKIKGVPVFRKGERLDEGDLALIAFWVLEAQELGQPRYTYLRQALQKHGYDFGKGGQEARVKDLVHRATAAGYLAPPPSSGRGPRKAGPALAGTTIVQGGQVTLRIDPKGAK